MAGRALQELFKTVIVPNYAGLDFSQKEELTALFMQEDDGSQARDRIESSQLGFLPWRSAEFVFSSIRAFFDSELYSVSIFKGLITSSGGLTESTLKASSGSLFAYL